MTRQRSVCGPRVLIVCVALAFTTVLAVPAGASCVDDPDALSIRQMIVQGTTGSERYDVLFLGRVLRLHDLGGDEGGPTIARFLVREDPVGSAPGRARVRFWKPPPGVGVSDNFEFRPGRHYAVVAHRRSNGVFLFDGACGQTTQLSRHRMWRLLRRFRRS
ncbi:MAG: hypothetical protein ABJC60_08915 [Actinomycetota bacterium]